MELLVNVTHRLAAALLLLLGLLAVVCVVLRNIK